MKNRKKFNEINVIPFIDIMLVLLVMVLTTATFIKQGIIPVDLPKAQESDKKEEKKEVHITVTKEGKLFLEKEALSASALEAELQKIDRDQTVVLSSDKQAVFQDFVTVMDILKRLNHEQLYIVTKE
ncbi:MAG: TonB system transport protein ExbD [Campylobacterota bacterium]|nr:TonB system transport protein ExbD [Campylobacterota bacterium]